MAIPTFDVTNKFPPAVQDSLGRAPHSGKLPHRDVIVVAE